MTDHVTPEEARQLVPRLRDVNEPNALIVARRAADALDSLAAAIATLKAAVQAARDKHDEDCGCSGEACRVGKALNDYDRSVLNERAPLAVFDATSGDHGHAADDDARPDPPADASARSLSTDVLLVHVEALSDQFRREPLSSDAGQLAALRVVQTYDQLFRGEPKRRNDGTD